MTKSKDRYAAIRPPVTPQSTSAPPMPFPATPTAAGAASPAAKQPATPSAAGAYQPRKSSGPSSSPPPAGAELVSPDRAASISRTLLQEYIAASNLREAREAAEELHAEQRFIIVAEAVTKALAENKHRAKIAELCAGLFNERLLTRGDFARGLTQSLAAVDADWISDECPKAAEFLGSLLSVWLEARCLSLPVLPAAAAHLTESGETANIFMHTASALLGSHDAHTARTLLESGGVDVLALFGAPDEEENMKEAARLFQRKEFMLQLYPTAPYESDLRHGVRQALTHGSAAPFVSVLSQHAADHAHPAFLRSVVESILRVALASKSAPDAAAIGRLFSGLHSAVGPASLAAQLGALQTAAAVLTPASSPSGLLVRVFEQAQASGLLADPTLAAQLEDDAQQLQLDTPKDFSQALKAIS